MNIAEFKEKIKPWHTIWYQPRSTFQVILERYSENNFLYIFFFSLYTPIAVILIEEIKTQESIVATFVFGFIIGIIAFHVIGFMFTTVGGGFGGQGEFKEVMCAFLWSFLPLVPISVIVFGARLLLIQFSEENIPVIAGIIVVIFTLIFYVLNIYRPIIQLILVAEAHKFSIWKSILVHFLSGILLVSLFILFSPIIIGIARYFKFM